MINVTLNKLPEAPYYLEESLNRLRINLGFCGKDIKRILIVSSVPNEGKSFVSMNLWRSFAAAGTKTVLVDADLRKSLVKSRYEITADSTGPEIRGLASYLAGKTALDDILLHTNVSGGDLILTRTTVSNPALLLENGMMPQLMDQLNEQYEVVLLDAPPLENVADGLKLASMCDGVVLVVQANSTPRALIQNSISAIQSTGCPLLGVVLNRAAGDGSGYYYYKKYGRYGKYKRYSKYSRYSKYGRYAAEPYAKERK